MNRTVHMMIDGRLSKVCSGCKTIKPLTEFGPNVKAYFGRQPHCRSCDSEREARRRTRPEVHSANMRTKEERRRSDVRWVRDYLSAHPCVDCGENDPVVLEFDHVRGTKDASIAKVLGSWSRERLEAEIAKCEVRCANCHRKRTAKQLNYYDYLKEIDQ